jgi:hypothetical protein
MATKAMNEFNLGCLGLAVAGWAVGGLFPMVFGLISQTTYIGGLLLGVVLAAPSFMGLMGRSQASADRLKRPIAMQGPDGNPAAVLQAYPYLAKAEAIGHGVEYYGWRSYPLAKNSESDLLAFHMALHISALWERHKRGFPIHDRAGNLKALELLPDQGWIVLREENDDGSESVVVAYDAHLRNASSSFENAAVRLGEKKGIELIAPLTSKQEVEQAYGVGLNFYDRKWLRLHALTQDSDGRWVRSENKNISRGSVPLLSLKLRELTFRNERPNPLAPPSTEKGDAQFGWPEEWS